MLNISYGDNIGFVSFWYIVFFFPRLQNSYLLLEVKYVVPSKYEGEMRFVNIQICPVIFIK
ncbi:hypothetical protein J5U23_01926 [Saccharolobus shibatae B12]|uniref:Uncharacterized protein n=2 Tax=Saccharolobus shibatae TaxID=2286 RepID=A0A8F5GU57_SACSH|nr:hypothetical protein J5U23_01926 [Saccharolobus shibatae B12]QXJ35332.1 hypothetical protein J5U22_01879 [Saccharolobus shibatae]